MQFPIMVGLHRSRFMDVAIVLVHAVALAGVMATPWLPEWQMILSILVVLHALWSLRQAGLRVHALRLYADCQLAMDDQESRHAVLPGSYVHPWLTVFRFRDTGGVLRRIVVLPDSAAPDEARRLRVWLRWKVSANAGDDV